LGLEFTARNFKYESNVMSLMIMAAKEAIALSTEEVRSVIAFTRAVSQPPYQPPGRPASQYSAK